MLNSEDSDWETEERKENLLSMLILLQMPGFFMSMFYFITIIMTIMKPYRYLQAKLVPQAMNFSGSSYLKIQLLQEP